jgi:hypothetical protein
MNNAAVSCCRGVLHSQGNPSKVEHWEAVKLNRQPEQVMRAGFNFDDYLRGLQEFFCSGDRMPADKLERFLA